MMVQTEQDTTVYYLFTYPQTGFESSNPKLKITCSSKETESSNSLSKVVVDK